MRTYTRYNILGLMSFSESNLFNISSQSNIWNILNVINILGTYICTEEVCAHTPLRPKYNTDGSSAHLYRPGTSICYHLHQHPR
jgi:hypothetical protein